MTIFCHYSVVRLIEQLNIVISQMSILQIYEIVLPEERGAHHIYYILIIFKKIDIAAGI